jgi:hypothetical protein
MSVRAASETRPGGPLSRHKTALLRLFDQTQKLAKGPYENRLIGLAIQEELIVRISRAERRIRRMRVAVSDTKLALKRRENSKAEAAGLKSRLSQLHDATQRQKDLINLLRDIGDSIAFIYVNRFDLKPLAFKEPPGFITGKAGARLERSSFRLAYKHGVVGILNDITHTLRHGDVTILRQGRPMDIIEAKSGKGGKRSRGERQVAAAQTMLDYLRDDVRHEEAGSWRRVETMEAPVSLADKATSLAQRLPRGGSLHEKVEPGLHYILIDCEAGERAIKDAMSVVDAASRPYLIFVNEMKKEQLGYMPFPLHFTDTEITYRFYNGDFVMVVVVELSYLESRMVEAGMTFELTDDGDLPFKVGPIGRDEEKEGVSFVGYHPMGRLAAEFVSLDWLIKNVLVGPLADSLFEEMKERAAARRRLPTAAS